MTTLRPRGVNHLAMSTCDMKGQLEYWSDVLGCPLKALYWMHGVEADRSRVHPVGLFRRP